MPVDKLARAILAPVFAQFIRGEIWDAEYGEVEWRVRNTLSQLDGAVEEALFWGEVLCLPIDSMKYSGDRALHPELLEKLERLVIVLQSNEEYNNPKMFEELAYFESLSPWLTAKPVKPSLWTMIDKYPMTKLFKELHTRIWKWAGKADT